LEAADLRKTINQFEALSETNQSEVQISIGAILDAAAIQQQCVLDA
jgi:hypothetical protein